MTWHPDIPLEYRNQIVTGDALQLWRNIPEGSIDAVIIDPPYCAGAISEAQRTRANGQGLRSDTIKRFGWFVGDNMGTAGLAWLLRNAAIEAVRTSKPTGHFLTFCDWRMIPTIEPAIESAGLRWQALVIWDKGSFGLGLGFRHQHECVLHFTCGAPEYHDLSKGDVLKARRVSTDDRVHQTQKPVDLLIQLIEVTTPPGGVVLDVFGGSASIAEACLITGRQYIVFEIDPATAELARERVRNTQPPLFVPEPEQMELAV